MHAYYIPCTTYTYTHVHARTQTHSGRRAPELFGGGRNVSEGVGAGSPAHVHFVKLWRVAAHGFPRLRNGRNNVPTRVGKGPEFICDFVQLRPADANSKIPIR